MGLDDARPTPAHVHNDGQNYHPTNRGVLFGHHFAAISGAGPLIGPVLAIQFGYMPGLLWLVIGVCIAGAVQDMLVLAASVRNDGKSLAELARRLLGGVPGNIAAIAILFIVIIALSGLGMVVVKALGGERINLAAGTKITSPEPLELIKNEAGTLVKVPAKSTTMYPSGVQATRSEGFTWQVPGEVTTSSPTTRSSGWYIRSGARQQLGQLYYLLHDTDRAVRGLVHVPHSAGPRRRSIADRCGGGAGGYCGRQLDSRFRAGTLFLAQPLIDHYGDMHLWLRGFGLAGVVVAVSTRLSIELSEDRHDCSLGRWHHCGQSSDERSASERSVRGRRWSLLRRRDLSLRVHLYHVRRDIWFSCVVSSGTTPKMVNKETDVRMIGYGSMLLEGLVGVVALLAAAALPQADYWAINIKIEDIGKYADRLVAMAPMWIT